MTITDIATLIGEISLIIVTITPVMIRIIKITDGQKCQLRSDMLRIYYHNCEQKTIRQYEFENFIFLYEAYKALKGNSFIDKIYEEVKDWEVVT